MPHRTAWKIALLIFLTSLPLKLLLAHNLPWEIDYVPLIWRGWQFLQGGPFPAVGTLSSVAAYNMPFLVWLHLPALALTHHAGLTMLLTMLAWNALTSAYLYALGRVLFRPIVGVFAVLIFAFSPVGISGAYTSWAQLLLPGFYTMTLYHLWQWHATDKARHLALCGVIALCAFMTHFSAIMLFPSLLLGALLLRVRWSLRPLLIGGAIGGLLLAPYLLFEVGRGFADVRAFATRKVQIAPDILAQYEQYKAENRLPVVSGVNSAAQAAPTLPPDSPDDEAIPPAASVQDRIVKRLNETWLQIKTVLILPSTQEFASLPAFNGVNVLMTLSLWGAVGWGVYRTGRVIWRSGRRNAWLFWRESDAGRALLVAGFGLLATGLMIALHAGQYTYYYGLLGPMYLLIAYAWMEVWRSRLLVGRGLIVLLAILWFVSNSADRLTGYQQHDDTAFTALNTSLYRHTQAVTDIIAQDWGRTEPVTVSYDLLAEQPNFWWLPAWGSVDPLYRVGAPYDVLLAMNHNLTNTNTSLSGPADQPDYIVIYTPALARYEQNRYLEIGRDGTTVVLKPRLEP